MEGKEEFAFDAGLFKIFSPSLTGRNDFFY